MIRCVDLAALVLLCAPLAAAADATVDVPDWVMAGILTVETGSHYDARGAIVYVDQRIGAAGERGPFQMTRDAFDLIKHAGESFEDLSTDLVLAESCCRRYLRLLFRAYADRDWFTAAGRWNAGPHGPWVRLWRYAKRVQIAGATK